MLRQRRPAQLLVIVAYLALLALPILLWGNVRFHLPVLPFAAVLAAAAPLAFARREGVSTAAAGNIPEDVPAL
jgi:hypothetical protein